MSSAKTAIKAVLFDFWGTLVEQGTCSPLRQSYKILGVHIPFSEFVPKFEDVLMTKHFDDQIAAFAAVYKAFSLESNSAAIERLIGLWNKNKLLAQPYTDTVDVLDALKKRKLKLGLVSNSPAFSTEAVLEKFGMQRFFDVVQLSCCAGKLKQDSLISDAVKAIGVKPSEALMVGDSIETDIRGAEHAKVKGILIDRRGTRDWNPKIATLNELEKHLQ